MGPFDGASVRVDGLVPGMFDQGRAGTQLTAWDATRLSYTGRAGDGQRRRTLAVAGLRCSLSTPTIHVRQDCISNVDELLWSPARLQSPPFSLLPGSSVVPLGRTRRGGQPIGAGYPP